MANHRGVRYIPSIKLTADPIFAIHVSVKHMAWGTVSCVRLVCLCAFGPHPVRPFLYKNDVVIDLT